MECSYLSSLSLIPDFSKGKHLSYKPWRRLLTLPFLQIIDNNQGPDCLAGPRALDHNLCRQSTLFITQPLSGSPIFAW